MGLKICALNDAKILVRFVSLNVDIIFATNNFYFYF